MATRRPTKYTVYLAHDGTEYALRDVLGVTRTQPSELGA